MVRINRVYTRKGDGGNTSLVGGQAIGKEHLRVECFGTVDELNCALGLARSFNGQGADSPERERMERLLAIIQQKLFDLGAELATPPGSEYQGQVLMTAQDVTWMEDVIDTLNEDLPSLESFVLPGGGPVTAFLHQARAVCRRAERLAVALSRTETVGEQAIAYMNRLSDALFVMGRWSAHRLGETEVLWQPGIRPDDSWK